MQLLKDSGIFIDKDLIAKKFQVEYGKTKKNETFMLDKELLEELAKDYNLAIFTGRPRKEAIDALKKYNAMGHFKMVVAMEDSKKQKPNPDGLIKILDAIINMEAYYFGDSIDDMNAARLSPNAKAIGVLPPNDKSDSMSNLLLKNGAMLVINEINDIKEALDENC